MKLRQIVTPIEQYFVYKLQIQRYKQALNWELLEKGENENVILIRRKIATKEEEMGKLLDMEV